MVADSDSNSCWSLKRQWAAVMKTCGEMRVPVQNGVGAAHFLPVMPRLRGMNGYRAADNLRSNHVWEQEMRYGRRGSDP